jgi:LmbE family N-acetylglucosaminyl deacetylase
MLRFDSAPDRPLSILCLGAHSDDIEIGCGGTLLRLLRDNGNVAVMWVVFGSAHLRTAEARRSADLFLAGARAAVVVVKDFRDGYFPYIGGEIKDYFEQLKHEFSPDLVFTHYRDDRHQDHRLISDLTWNTFRRHLILEYEIPKYDGDLGTPNFFVQLDEATCRTKIEHLLTCFATQANKHWFTADTFWSLLRLRGIEANRPATYAEAFYCRKMTI